MCLNSELIWTSIHSIVHTNSACIHRYWSENIYDVYNTVSIYLLWHWCYYIWTGKILLTIQKPIKRSKVICGSHVVVWEQQNLYEEALQTHQVLHIGVMCWGVWVVCKRVDVCVAESRVFNHRYHMCMYNKSEYNRIIVICMVRVSI